MSQANIIANLLQLVLLLLPWSDGAIIPDVTTTLKGDKIVIRFPKSGHNSTEYQIHFTPFESAASGIVYSQSSEGINPKFAGHYMISENPNAFELTVLNTSENQVGTYEFDSGDRSIKMELVLLEPPGLTCDSTLLRKDNCETDMRFECSAGYYGNVVPPVEFWMVTGGGTFGPIPATAKKENHTSKTTLIQNLISCSGNIHYACRIRDVNTTRLEFRSNCSFDGIGQPYYVECFHDESKTNQVCVIVPPVFSVFAITAAGIYITIYYRRRNQADTPGPTRENSELGAIGAVEQQNLLHEDTTRFIQSRRGERQNLHV